MEPIVSASLGWLVSKTCDSIVRGLCHLLGGGKQQNALADVVAKAIASAVGNVVAPGQLDAVREALDRELPDSEPVRVSDIADLRAAVLGQVGPRVAVLADQGFDIDSGRLIDEIAARIVAGISADADRGGPLQPLAERLRHEDIAARMEALKVGVGEVATELRLIGEMVAAPVEQPGRFVPQDPAGWPLSDLPGPVALGVRRTLSAGVGLPVLTDYVPRPHDERLEKIIARAGRMSVVVALVGDSCTGKTRALWEAMRLLPGAWRVWHPGSAPGLHEGLVGGRVAPRTVVWLDDAHEYLDPERTELAGANATRLRDLTGDPRARPVLVAATLWLDEWRRLSTDPGEVPQAYERHHAEGLAQVAALLEAADQIPIPQCVAGEDLEAMREASARDARLAIALKHAAAGKTAQGAAGKRITQYLAGAQHLLGWYETAGPSGRALIDAAIDARRLGHDNRLPQHFLTEAAEGYIDEADRGRFSDDWPTTALASATVKWRGLVSPLTRFRPRGGEAKPDEPEYELADVLEQAGAGARKFTVPPGEFWTAAARYAHADALGKLADAAQARGRYRDAAALHLKTGSARALGLLAELREQAGDHVAAERLAARAVAAGDSESADWLTWKRERAGDCRGAERIAARAAEAGYCTALRGLARRRYQAGDGEAGERLFHLALEAGDGWALGREAWKQERAGNRAAAEQLAVRAATGGYAKTLRDLVLKCQRAGNRAAAERLCQLGADARDGWALGYLARKREEARDHAAADRLAIEAADAGYSKAMVRLAEARERSGNRVAADHLALTAADAGHQAAVLRVVQLRDEREDGAGAERLAAVAADVGHAEALLHLAKERERSGKTAAAERAYRLAVHAGETWARGRLALLREKAGDHAAAERLAFAEADAGRTETLASMALRRDRTGDTAVAERLARKAAAAGDTEVLCDMADSRRMAGDQGSAERLYQMAADTGDTYALSRLAEFRRETGDRAGA